MELKRKKPEAHILTITPDLASRILNTSPGNRRQRGWYVDLLAAAMKRDEWKVTNQGIGIDSLGRLRDAHHRLTACIKSGVPFESLVVFGLDPSVYEVIDTGIKRNVEDLLDIESRIAQPLRLGASFTLSNQKPTAAQLKPFMKCGLYDALKALTEYCGTSRKYYSSAAMKLAAVITIMNGGNADFVMQQYRGLCLLDFDNLSSSAKGLIRQVNSKKVNTVDQRDTLARGFKVFDFDRRDISKIQITDVDLALAAATVREVLQYHIENTEEV